jgi:hypothetical protein
MVRFVLFLAAAFVVEPLIAVEQAAPLKIVARKRLQGPSQWGVPADFHLIRSFTELVRAVGLNEANVVHQEFSKPKLDFERFMFVYVSAGSQRSSGYAVNIVDVTQRNGGSRPQIVVRWSLYEPKGYVLTVITTPAELVMIERAEGEPIFERVPFASEPPGAVEKGGPPVEKSSRSETQSTATVDWESLVREYDSLDLPRPPADARLTAKFYEMELVDVRDLVVPLHAPRYLLGFATNAAAGRRLFVGTETLAVSSDEADLIEVDADGPLPGVVVDAYGWGAFEIDVALPTAVECYRRGRRELADQLLRSRSPRSFEHPQSSFHQPAGLPLEVALRHVAWTHWGNQLTEKGSDRAAIHGRMADLLNREPALQTAPRKALLEALGAALKPSTAAPGTAERLLDDLVEVDALFFDQRGAVGVPAPIVELSKRGWEAMPAILAHLDDRRLTRSLVRPWDGSATYIPQVGELASSLVREFAGDESLDWKQTPDGRFLRPEPVRDWWRRAEAAGEEKYLVEHVIPRLPRSTMPYEAMIARLAVKYPARLPEVYRRALAERPDINSWALVSALTTATEPTVAADVLAEGAAHAKPARQVQALEGLSTVDEQRFHAALIAALAALAPKPIGRYTDCDQVALARLCRRSERAEIWEALRRAAANVDVGVRMEILDEMGRTPKPPYEVWKRSADLLAAFLDDTTVRDTAADSQRFAGCAGAWLPKLEVRNWAAYQLAVLLGIDVSRFHGTQAVGDEQWSALRKEVAARRREM